MPLRKLLLPRGPPTHAPLGARRVCAPTRDAVASMRAATRVRMTAGTKPVGGWVDQAWLRWMVRWCGPRSLASRRRVCRRRHRIGNPLRARNSAGRRLFLGTVRELSVRPQCPSRC
jgi:hypothetical protein